MTGQKLMQKREELGLTVERLAELLAVDARQVEAWENEAVVCAPYWSIFDRAMEHLEYELTPDPDVEAVLARAQAAIESADRTIAGVK